MDLIDIGANLCHESFAQDRDAVLSRATAAGVSQIIVTGSCLQSSRDAQALAAAHPANLFSTVGLHPHLAEEFGPALIEAFRELAVLPQIVAVGETGLDFFRDLSPRAVQEASFHAHLALAVELQRPVFLHQRDAHDRFLPILREYLPDLPAAVVHCFTGSDAELDDYLALDLHIGITGWICDERRGHHLLDMVHRVPGDRLMVETDAPYLLPRDLRPRPRSRRNEPMYLPHIAEAVARARGETPETLAAATSTTARRFFALPEAKPPESEAGRMIS